MAFDGEITSCLEEHDFRCPCIVRATCATNALKKFRKKVQIHEYSILSEDGKKTKPFYGHRCRRTMLEGKSFCYTHQKSISSQDTKSKFYLFSDPKLQDHGVIGIEHVYFDKHRTIEDEQQFSSVAETLTDTTHAGGIDGTTIQKLQDKIDDLTSNVEFLNVFVKQLQTKCLETEELIKAHKGILSDDDEDIDIECNVSIVKSKVNESDNEESDDDESAKEEESDDESTKEEESDDEDEQDTGFPDFDEDDEDFLSVEEISMKNGRLLNVDQISKDVYSDEVDEEGNSLQIGKFLEVQNTKGTISFKGDEYIVGVVFTYKDDEYIKDYHGNNCFKYDGFGNLQFYGKVKKSSTYGWIPRKRNK